MAPQCPCDEVHISSHGLQAPSLAVPAVPFPVPLLSTLCLSIPWTCSAFLSPCDFLHLARNSSLFTKLTMVHPSGSTSALTFLGIFPKCSFSPLLYAPEDPQAFPFNPCKGLITFVIIICLPPCPQTLHLFIHHGMPAALHMF